MLLKLQCVSGSPGEVTLGGPTCIWGGSLTIFIFTQLPGDVAGVCPWAIFGVVLTAYQSDLLGKLFKSSPTRNSQKRKASRKASSQ